MPYGSFSVADMLGQNKSNHFCCDGLNKTQKITLSGSVATSWEKCLFERLTDYCAESQFRSHAALSN